MTTRNATTQDIPALERVKTPAVLHADRIRDASEGDFRYLVFETDADELVGHACLLFRRPRTWPEEEDASYPCVIDLMIREDVRSQGFGTTFLADMERICLESGAASIYLSVDPKEDADALRFYRRNGYLDLEDAPQWREWSFTDSEGNVHRGASWNLQLYRPLT